MLALEVENRLYRNAAHQLCLKMGLRNLSNLAIGLDPDFGLTINQWCNSPHATRQVIDERRLAYKPLTPDDCRDLESRFRRGLLTTIDPGQVHFCWVRFNGPADTVDMGKARENHLILSLDGQIRCSNGETCESVGRRDEEFGDADLSFSRPFMWSRVP
ncbi:hypothetical protein IV102_14475 [bacterium]|nr:hypothetical protein [bacterium]